MSAAVSGNSLFVKACSIDLSDVSRFEIIFRHAQIGQQFVRPTAQKTRNFREHATNQSSYTITLYVIKLQKQDNSNQADFSAASMHIRYACRAHPPFRTANTDCGI
ncbi:hypothetical protein [Neisseria elongata]|uniref:hypothetical protein n=1 Tax=Neisseria elongata TaxID=495 RepID=UPI0011865A93|nr:hypothetical protein [Neisseria elongata]